MTIQSMQKVVVLEQPGNYFDDPKPLTGSLRWDCVYIALWRLDYCTEVVVLSKRVFISEIQPLSKEPQFFNATRYEHVIWIRDKLHDLCTEYEIYFCCLFSSHFACCCTSFHVPQYH